MHRFCVYALACGLVLCLAGLAGAVPADEDVPFVRMFTEEGEILIALFPDLAPRHVDNFYHLAASGFYDDTTFHRVSAHVSTSSN